MVFGAKNSGRITLKERCEKDYVFGMFTHKRD
jgi:hypothetical protein